MRCITFKKWWNNRDVSFPNVPDFAAEMVWNAAQEAMVRNITSHNMGRQARKASTQSCPNCHQVKMVPVRVVTDYECKNCGYRA